MKYFPFSLLILLTACSHVPLRQQQSQGQIGCPKDEIQISDMTNSAAPSWTAVCHGKKFYCSQSGSLSLYNQGAVSCKEAMSEARN